MFRFWIALLLLMGLTLTSHAQDATPEADQCYRLAFIDANNRLIALDAETGATTPLLPERETVSTFVVAPDGVQIAFSRFGTTTSEYFVYNGQSTLRLPYAYAILRWSPDSQTLLVEAIDAAGASSIEQVDPATGARTLIDQGQAPVWSPDGSRIAYLSPNALELRLYDLAAGEIVSQTALPLPPQAPMLFWSPDGRTIAYAGRATTQQLVLFDVATVQARIVPEAVVVALIGWTQESAGVLFLGGEDFHLPLHLGYALTNGSVRRLTEPVTESLSVYNERFPLIYTYENTIYLLDALDAAPRMIIEDARALSLIGTPSPDARWLFYTLIDDPRLTLLDLTSGDVRQLDVTLPIVTQAMWVGC